jgi:hypothetical protein
MNRRRRTHRKRRKIDWSEAAWETLALGGAPEQKLKN